MSKTKCAFLTGFSCLKDLTTGGNEGKYVVISKLYYELLISKIKII